MKYGLKANISLPACSETDKASGIHLYLEFSSQRSQFSGGNLGDRYCNVTPRLEVLLTGTYTFLSSCLLRISFAHARVFGIEVLTIITKYVIKRTKKGSTLRRIEGKKITWLRR